MKRRCTPTRSASSGERSSGRNATPKRLAVLAVYHDASEILTGDLPTPIKYHDRTLRDAYKKVEHAADERLLAMRRRSCAGHTRAHSQHRRTRKSSSRQPTSSRALRQCIEERKAGNREFLSAEEQTRRAIEEMHLPEADWFMEHCLGAFEKNLDELGTM